MMMWGWFVSSIAWSAFVSGAFLAFGAIHEALHALRLWRSRRVPVSELTSSTGIVDLRGTARAEVPLMAPLTGRSCVQFTVVLERKQPRGGQKRDHRPDLITFIGTAPFVIDDGTGRMRVDLRDQRVPVTGASVEKRALQRLTAPLDKMLHARLGAPGGLWCVGRDIVATEAALVQGTEVSVIAKLARDGAVTPLHVLTGRAKVVALHGALKAALALSGAAALLFIFELLR
jgi:hypothetical protein